MYDPSSNSSLMSASPNRLLNLHSSKLSRSSQQQNLAKKLKVNHTNGLKGTTHEGSSTIRSASIFDHVLMLCFLLLQGSKSDTSLRCPLRQTLPIFKQPVTYFS